MIELLLRIRPLTLALAASIAVVPITGRAQGRASELDLRAVLDSVALRHPTVLAAQARLRAAAGTRTTVGRWPNPTLGYQVDGAPFPGQQLPSADREAMTMLTVPLEPLYQRRPRVKQADAQVRAAEAEVAATRQMVSLDAARTYYRAAQAQVRVDATLDVASWLDTIINYNRARVNEGVTAEADLIRSQVERDRTLAELTTARAELARAMADLATFIGPNELPPTRVAVPVTTLAIPRAVTEQTGPTNVVGGESDVTVLATRPDLRAARDRVSAAQAGMSIERSNLLRQFGATIGTKQIAGVATMLAGVSLPVPLFDQNRGEVMRAAAERDAAIFDLDATERTARAQRSGALQAARVLTAQASALSTRADTGFLSRAEQARHIALGAYREGAVPLLQVTDAERAWSEARMAFFDLLFAQHVAVLDLLYSTGQDLRDGLSVSSVRER